MTITIYTYCPFAAFFVFAFIPPIPFCSLEFAIFDVVMNWDARLNSIELISLEKLLLCIGNETSEKAK